MKVKFTISIKNLKVSMMIVKYKLSNVINFRFKLNKPKFIEIAILKYY